MADRREKVHFVGECGGNIYLLTHFLPKGSKCIYWNDGGFADEISKKAKAQFNRFYLDSFQATFTPGLIGKSYAKQMGFVESQIYNSYFSHDVDNLRISKSKKNHAKEKKLKILTISRLIDWKRLEDLFAALKIVDESIGSYIEFTLIGSGDHVKPVQKFMSEKLRLKKCYIEHVDYDQIFRFYNNNDIFILPSEGDIWGLVVNEALSYGLPVICTSKVGASELVIDGYNGYTVPTRDPLTIAYYINKIYEDKKLLDKLSINASKVGLHWNSSSALHEFNRMLSDLQCSRTK